MPILDQMIESGMFTQNIDGSISSAMFSLQEQLVAQEFAKEINSGRLDVMKAMRYFWAPPTIMAHWYMSGIPVKESDEPKWKNIMGLLGGLLDERKVECLINAIQEDYRSEQYMDPLELLLAKNKERGIVTEIVRGSSQRLKDKLLYVIKEYVDSGGREKMALTYMLRLKCMDEEINANMLDPIHVLLERNRVYAILGLTEEGDK